MAAKHLVTRTAADKHVEALRALVKRFNGESGDVVIGRMIPELAALMVTLSDQLDQAQRKVVYLTWTILLLTGVLVVMGFIQFFGGS